MKYLYVLGACGSIGTQTLDIVRNHPTEYTVIGMSVGSNLDLAKKLIMELELPKYQWGTSAHLISQVFASICVKGISVSLVSYKGEVVRE